MSKNLLNNCLCDFHPDLARCCFPAPAQEVSESAKTRKGGSWRPRKRLGAVWSWPAWWTCFTADPTHMKENWVVYFIFFFFYRLHHSRKCFCQLAAFLQSFLLWWVVVCPKNWLAIDSKYAFLCWKSFFFKMTFLYYWELMRAGKEEEQAWSPCFPCGNNRVVMRMPREVGGSGRR